MNVIEVEQLSHGFSKQALLLNQLNFSVPKGSIYGLLGANGAGKTTTLKLILGLIPLKTGRVLLFNKHLAGDRRDILSRTGALIETPAIYTHLSAYDNLRAWQVLYACPMERIGEVLRIVGLDNTGNKKAGDFSLGMKQRLAIAVSILNSPELLVLDEPTNGLDPAGIVEIRNLLTELNQQQGITIVVSSHILSEMEKLVSHLCIINGGSVVFEGPLAALMAQENSTELEISASDLQRAAHLLASRHALHIHEGKLYVSVSSQQAIAQLIETLVNNGIQLYEVSRIRKDLETAFMNLIH